MSGEVHRCQICGVEEVSMSVAVWRGGREQGRTFVCTVCAIREEKMLGRDALGVSLTRISASVAERQARRAGADASLGCPVCGASLAEVTASGLLGCGYCYTRFKEEVAASIRLAQGSLRHLGKSPSW